MADNPRPPDDNRCIFATRGQAPEGFGYRCTKSNRDLLHVHAPDYSMLVPVNEYGLAEGRCCGEPDGR